MEYPDLEDDHSGNDGYRDSGLSSPLGDLTSYKRFIDGCPDGCVILDDDLRYQYINSAARAMTRSTKGAAPGNALSFADGSAPHPSVTDIYRVVMCDGRPRSVKGIALGDREFGVRVFRIEGGLGAIWTETTGTHRSGTRLEPSQDELRALALHVIEIQEVERKLVARELHDELGQFLTSINYGLRRLLRGSPGPGKPERDVLIDLLDRSHEAISAVRRMSSKLRPSILDHLDIKAAIEWLAMDFSKNSGLIVTAKVDMGNDALDENTTTALFRISQEGLTNAARHSRASKATVELRSVRGCVRLSICDNGVGIDDAKANSRESFGILGMRERAQSLGGSFSIKGRAGRGTILAVKISLKGKEAR